MGLARGSSLPQDRGLRSHPSPRLCPRAAATWAPVHPVGPQLLLAVGPSTVVHVPPPHIPPAPARVPPCPPVLSTGRGAEPQPPPFTLGHPCHCPCTLPTLVTVWGWREGQCWAAVTVTIRDRATVPVALTCSASSQSGTETLPPALCPVCVCAGCLAICFPKFLHSPSSSPLGDSWVGAQLQQGWKTPWEEGCALLHRS